MEETVNLYEYAVVLQPKHDKDGEIAEGARIVVEPRVVLARDAAQAGMIAARAIPESEIEKLDRLSVVVRPF